MNWSQLNAITDTYSWTIGEDNDGQIIIYTDLIEIDGKLELLPDQPI